MEQLPNINEKYSIIDFDKERGCILVHFLRKNFERWIDIPVENGSYVTGLDLDNLIMSFAPVEAIKPIIKNQPSNTDYISSLIVDKFKHRADYLRQRDLLLARRAIAFQTSDWTQLPDVLKTMPEEEKQQWERFRQELRDITKQAGFPEKVIWPQRPYIMGTIVYE